LREAFEAVVASPNTASRRWVYRQYDHEVGARTAVGPGEDAAVLAIREAVADGTGTDAGAEIGVGLALASGAEPNWTACAPYEGARAVAVEVATNLAAVGAEPLAAVDCLNGGNPEKPDVYGGFAAAVDGLADGCRDLSVPVVGGNVSLYNDSAAGPVPPTPTLAMAGTRQGYDAPGSGLAGEGELLLVGPTAGSLGGSEYLARYGGSDGFPDLPGEPRALVDALASVARQRSTLALHDAGHGGLAVTLAEMVTAGAGVDAALPGEGAPAAELFCERPGRAVVETTEPGAVRAAMEGVAPVTGLGEATGDGRLALSVDGVELGYDHEQLRALRDVIERELDG
jgi:phosphoribosylformylglycinamidine synthase